MKRCAEIIAKIALVFATAFVITILFMIPVILLTMFTLSKKAAFTDWDAGALLREIWSSPMFFYGSTIAQAIGFIMASFLIYKWLESKREPRWEMGWSNRGLLLEVGKGLGIGTLLITITAVLMVMVGVIQISISPNETINWNTLIGYIVFMAIVSLNEEVLVRGYLQGLLRFHFGIWPAIVVSSLFFALMHGLNPGALEHPLPLVNAGLAGLLLAICRERSGGLWLPMGVHLAWNYVQGNILGFEVSGTTVPSLLNLERSGAPLLHGGSFGAEGSVITLIVMLIASIMTWYLYRSKPRGISQMH